MSCRQDKCDATKAWSDSKVLRSSAFIVARARTRDGQLTSSSGFSFTGSIVASLDSKETWRLHCERVDKELGHPLTVEPRAVIALLGHQEEIESPLLLFSAASLSCQRWQRLAQRYLVIGASGGGFFQERRGWVEKKTHLCCQVMSEGQWRKKKERESDGTERQQKSLCTWGPH